MQQHLPFLGLHTLAKLPHCKLSPPHLSWLLAAPACGANDSNISVADSVTISNPMIWPLSLLFAGKRLLKSKCDFAEGGIVPTFRVVGEIVCDHVHDSPATDPLGPQAVFRDCSASATPI